GSASLIAALDERPSAGPERPWTRVFAGVCELIPRSELPALRLVFSDDGPLDLVERAARLLADLAAERPGLTLSGVFGPSRFGDYSRGAADCRAKWLLGASVVRLGGLAGETAPAAEGSDPSEHAAPAGLIAPCKDDEARSLAERILFDQLESL